MTIDEVGADCSEYSGGMIVSGNSTSVNDEGSEVPHRTCVPAPTMSQTCHLEPKRGSCDLRKNTGPWGPASIAMPALRAPSEMPGSSVGGSQKPHDCRHMPAKSPLSQEVGAASTSSGHSCKPRATVLPSSLQSVATIISTGSWVRTSMSVGSLSHRLIGSGTTRPNIPWMTTSCTVH
eukprot:scaffold641_cov490-Prasinococcus_capsulatus_cf.AAC.9